MTIQPQGGYDQLYPHQFYHYMLEAMPILHVEERHAWQVFRYEDVQHILREHGSYSSQIGLARLSGSLPSIDPPRHRKLRDLLSQRFTPRMVAARERRITAIVHNLLDLVIKSGRMDVVDDLAHPLPTIVIAELLGIPPQDRALFRRWSDAIVSTAMTAPNEDLIQSEMAAYFRQIIEQRRHTPQDDLISELLAAEIDGEKLSEEELLSFSLLLLVAGNETTTTLLGNAMMCFFNEFPEVVSALRDDPSLIPDAIEEVLRYRSPMRIIARRATADILLGEHQIPAGDRVVCWLAAANVDERAFPNALTFNIHRVPNRHLAFGYGIHFCLGAPLARLEAKVALTAFLERFEDIQRVDEPLEPISDAATQGVKHFPITFHARS